MRFPSKRTLVLIAMTVSSVVTSRSANGMIVIDDPALSTGNPSTATINGAIFTVAPITGGTDTHFLGLNIGGNGTEAGHNSSSGTLLNDETSASALQLTDIPIVMNSGTSYFQIWLDINEASSNKAPVTIDRLMTFTSPTDGLTYSGGGGPITDPVDGDLGTLRYTTTPSNADLVVTVGQVGDNPGDVEILLPLSNFAGANSNDYLYLWARIADVDGGGEEFALNTQAGQTFLPPNVAVPEPSAFVLLGLVGAFACTWKRIKGYFVVSAI